jgi:hypothetical protein
MTKISGFLWRKNYLDRTSYGGKITKIEPLMEGKLLDRTSYGGQITLIEPLMEGKLP